MRSVAFLSHFQAINCGKPTVPEHGSVVGESTRYPNTITYSCEDGYEIEGPAWRSCQANGTWSGNEAETRCKRKYQYTVIFILVCDSLCWFSLCKAASSPQTKSFFFFFKLRGWPYTAGYLVWACSCIVYWTIRSLSVDCGILYRRGGDYRTIRKTITISNLVLFLHRLTDWFHVVQSS